MSEHAKTNPNDVVEIRLHKKIFVRGKIEAVTGLHIGGSGTALDIGGLGLGVIKNPLGIPFIPGSSLKGKLRSLAARKHDGAVDVSQDCKEVVRVFGQGGDTKDAKQPTRLLVRDCDLDALAFRNTFKGIDDFLWTEVKTENSIDRKKGAAENPRPVERVPAGAKFSFELIYNVFNPDEEKEDIENILSYMRILQDDYLGGQGSRGYGKVRFIDVKITEKPTSEYMNTSPTESETSYKLEG